ncbi:uncharacterized protein LOC130801106 [Amaranthus tricolor]|uniref:uncharacterized protein LOC130801106 n=1 Tax=Amaranthus tricolor TaxID=29722 RepID=UPI00258649A0|nr:uncharacterized protein LOC130801106 [Amaranthus tricolor]
MVEFSYNNSYQASIQMAPFEALYGRRCRNPICWDDFSESVTLGPAMLEEMTDQVKMIRERLKAAQDRQNSYADLKRRPDEFAVGDYVLLRVSPMKGVMRFGKRGKLSPKFIGPYEVTEKVGKVAYRLALPNELGKVHDVFHISQLKRYVPDKSHVLDPEPLDLDENLSYEEKPIKILDSKVRSTRRKDIKMVKVLWANQRRQEATWETEDSMREKYPHLFPEVFEIWMKSIELCIIFIKSYDGVKVIIVVIIESISHKSGVNCHLYYKDDGGYCYVIDDACRIIEHQKVNYASV